MNEIAEKFCINTEQPFNAFNRENSHNKAKSVYLKDYIQAAQQNCLKTSAIVMNIPQ